MYIGIIIIELEGPTKHNWSCSPRWQPAKGFSGLPHRPPETGRASAVVGRRLHPKLERAHQRVGHSLWLSTVRLNIIKHGDMLCYAMPCHAMPCHTMLYHAMPCYYLRMIRTYLIMHVIYNVMYTWCMAHHVTPLTALDGISIGRRVDANTNSSH